MSNSVSQISNACYIYAVTIWQQHPFTKIKEIFEKIAKRYVFQLEECPSTKTRHFQCFLNLRIKKRLHEVKTMLNGFGLGGAHVTIASSNGKEQLKQYCMKLDSRVSGPWADRPIYLGADLITVLRPWQKAIVDLAYKPLPHPRKIHWFYDAIGGLGKSSIVKYMYYHLKVLTVTIGKASDLLNLVYKMQGKKMYCFDISRTCTSGAMTEIYLALEAVKNGYFVNTKYDTGVACFEIPHIVVFSNHLPLMSALSVDRWNIIDMSQMCQENLILD